MTSTIVKVIWADFGSIRTYNNNKARRNAGFAVRTRLELATYGVTGRYSNQLNYRTNCDCTRLPLQEAHIRFLSQKRLQKYCVFLNYQNFLHFFCIFSFLSISSHPRFIFAKCFLSFKVYISSSYHSHIILKSYIRIVKVRRVVK